MPILNVREVKDVQYDNDSDPREMRTMPVLDHKVHTIHVSGPPEPWTVQIRGAERSKAYLEMKAYKEAVQAEAKNYWRDREPMTGLIRLHLDFYRALPKGKDVFDSLEWIKENIIEAPDLTNYEKAAEDALQGIIIVNDSQVVSKITSKWYAHDAFTRITIEELAPAGKLPCSSNS